jgi:hypothetical protein
VAPSLVQCPRLDLRGSQSRAKARGPSGKLSNMISAKGHNGTVHFDGRFVTIERTGFLARASVGKGTKRIPITSIQAIQWKPPGMLVNGYIEFTLGRMPLDSSHPVTSLRPSSSLVARHRRRSTPRRARGVEPTTGQMLCRGTQDAQ